MGRKYATKI